MWFEVDKAGLAAQLEGRGKAFAVFELVHNAWDAKAQRVSIELEPIASQPYALLRVSDDGQGWMDLSASHTVFGRSTSGGDPERSGRFGLGEKLVLALCRRAKIISTSGTVIFSENGRRRSSDCVQTGAIFEGEIRMTRDELADVEIAVEQLIPPVPTTYNGRMLTPPMLISTFTAKLQTELRDGDQVLRRCTRETTVEVYRGEPGGILELGVPVCDTDWPWRLNVKQKIPLTWDRSMVSDAYRRSLQVQAINALAHTLDPEQAAAPWASEATEDVRANDEALQQVLTLRFGERRASATPNNPIANAAAAKAGFELIHPGSLSSGQWANYRKRNLIPSAAKLFPAPVLREFPNPPEFCPTCKQRLLT